MADDGAQSVSGHITFGLAVCAGQTVDHSLPRHSKRPAIQNAPLSKCFHFLPAQLRVPKRPQGQIQLPVARPVVDEPEVDEQVGHGAPILLAIVYVRTQVAFRVAWRESHLVASAFRDYSMSCHSGSVQYLPWIK